MHLRDYQVNLKSGIYSGWQHARNMLAVLPTGGGKTVVFADILAETQGPSCAIAHRQELVSQISLALAINNVKHKIIGPNDIIKWIVQLHVEETGRPFYDPNANTAVAGVDTLIRRGDTMRPWLNNVQRWVIDEAHHVLTSNKWGRAVELFPNAYGLGVTATPLRADGKGLGRHADGVFDKIIEGPSMRNLIKRGYLTDYRIFAPPSDISRDRESGGLDDIISKTTGDFNQTRLRQRMHRSQIVGDVVKHYLRLANGKQGVTFAVDVEEATRIANEFKAAGVKAEVIHSGTKDKIRVEIIRRFRRKQIQQIVNVDILGEGFDVPGIEVISFARPTESYGLYAQQFGRALRVLDGKLCAIIIDHVGNVQRHGLPDAPKNWTLDARERRSRTQHDPDAIPVKTCANCTAMYEAIYKSCPFCGHTPVIGNRSQPQFVDGDLTELDPATLAAMRGEVFEIMEPADKVRRKMMKANAPGIVVKSAVKSIDDRREAQRVLRESIALWAGWQKFLNRSDSESYRRFYFKFGIDVLGAQVLGRPDAQRLTLKINNEIMRLQNENGA